MEHNNPVINPTAPSFSTVLKSIFSSLLDKVIIVSASIENWILPWAEKEGIEIVLATQIEVNEEERLTGYFSSPNCYGKEKVKRILEMYPNRENYILIAYGDSSGDFDMLSFADNGYII